MSNLFKGNYIMISEQSPYIVDSNAIVEQRLNDLAMQASLVYEQGDGEFTEGLNAETVADLLTADPGETPEGFSEGIPAMTSGNVIKAEHRDVNAEADAIIQAATEQAQTMADEIVASAQAEAERIKKLAHDEGFSKGLSDGQKRADAMMAEQQAQLDAVAADLQQEFEDRVNELEPLLVDIISDVYNHVFKVDFAQHKDLIVTLIRDTLRGSESQTGYIVHVSSEDYQFVTMQKKELTMVVPGDVPFDIVEDMNLKHNECFVETGNGIYDCGLDTQLSQLRKELMLLSYRKN